ncbi:MAG: GNAT family N-acetyltransferase [Phenylobacterium sp.]|jgi:RimJ/RimL family protein N-acetyltransferase|uniref:GNAT family N-acetyltransferase n=1 Tax=Phenylobacterium sp. TaxID=1871053 RepID=UPI001B6DFF50|nr:GNAT family N-acetyltransferase [Phenylobacterium sp.]MBP7815286.1 GNAT family N-acetyltransferase [Phenylobacterium sp.]MBP9232942.1 GNAT family N-acetyltransferase [Phenylobacterium sp.]MBP9754202.1 GNAT family N-acetyltransferase [Phenylobacterium sp.]
MIVFETPRLILRPRGLEHLEACVAINSDPEVMRYVGPVWPPAQQREHLTRQFATDRGEGLGHWAIFRKTAPEEMLGWALLVPLEGTDAVQIGYRLKRAAWGDGIATEAGQRLVAHGLETLRLPSLAAWTHPDNAGSKGVLIKLGFVPDGPYEENGEVRDLYRLTPAARQPWAKLASMAGGGAS